MRRMSLVLLSWVTSSLFLASEASAALPTGFTMTPVAGPWEAPVGVAFDANGRMYVWERAGRVWIVEDGVKSATPLVDISDEVANWGEHGLLGFALHPNFLETGWIYLFYAVDHYYLENAGQPGYDPALSDTNAPQVLRITRYTANAATGFHTVDPASRRVLLGESAGTGCPTLFESHGTGSLAFGADDSLLASCGDGASYIGPDTGGPTYGAYTEEGLAEGIISAHEDVGAYRAQLVSSLAGKVLRLDPQTGDGLPSNPFYDPEDPRAARSRVFALGFRNPFRFTVRPHTGSHLPSDAAPGSIYLGNVGWNLWEEIEVVDGPGYNGGWPLYEGMEPHPGYQEVGPVANLDAPNPLWGSNGGCTQPYFSFSDLLVQETLGTPSFPNPCDATKQIPAGIPRFMHRRPGLAYGRDVAGQMVTPTFSNGVPTFAQVGAPGSPVAGTQINGSTASGEVWYTGSDFPPAFQNSFFHADLGSGTITNIRYDANDQPTLVTPFGTVGGIVMLATSPTTGGLYLVDLGAWVVYRISYAASGDLPPTAVASATPGFGTTPLSVTFDGSGSSDPEGQPLTYSWNFGDGSPLATSANPGHTFYGPVGVPTTYNVTLTVRDAGNQPAIAQTAIAVNDTPPQVSITSPASQGLYSMLAPSVVQLTADVSDAEQGAGQLSCQWQVTLHHNGDAEPGPIDTSCSSSATILPLGCNGNSYSYTFALTVSDGVGLSTTRDVTLFPDCAALFPVVCGNIDGNAQRNGADVTRLRSAFSRPTTAPLSAAERARCSVIGDASCDLVDLVVLRRYLAGKTPGIAQVCSAVQ